MRFDEDHLWLDLADGRMLAVPLAWFARLLQASAVQREKVKIGPHGLHRDDLDEDISIEGLLAGRGDMSNAARVALARARLAAWRLPP